MTSNFELTQDAKVGLLVYDISGQIVKVLVDENKQPGTYQVEFNASTVVKGLANGEYYYKLLAGNFVETKQMVLLR